MIQVLTIDDSKAIHAFLTDVMDGTQINLTHAFDGLEGMEKLQLAGAQYDLILLDWEMPRLTGIDTLTRLRAVGIKTPVIMLTSKNDPGDIMRALSAGATEYAMKPFTRDVLLDKIETVLERKVA